MKRRLFVAIKISKSLQNEVLKWQNKFTAGKIRWLSGKNLHITLVPPWYAQDFKPVAIILRKIACDLPTFKIQFSHIAYGPDPRRPRLVWVKGTAPKELSELKKLLENALDKQTASSQTRLESRPFLLHLTLGRFRPADFSQFKIKELDEKVFWKDEVSSIVLMESHLSPSGAEYKVLEEFKF